MIKEDNVSNTRIWPIALAVVGWALPTAVYAQDDAGAVRAVMEAHARFAQEKNLDAADTLWAQDRGVHIIEGAGVNHGWIDYRDNHLKPELDHFEEFRYQYRSIEPVVRGNVAWTSFQYDLFIKMEGREIDQVGRGTAVLEKREGQWLIVHLHTSGRDRPTERQER
jgi:ketosteroid isomerase-like protein